MLEKPKYTTSRKMFEHHTIMPLFIHKNGGIGDVLLSTAIIKALRRTHHRKIFLETLFPELLQNNPDIVFSFDAENRVRLTRKLYMFKGGWYLAKYMNRAGDKLFRSIHYQFPSHNRHIIDGMADDAGVTLLPEERRPWLYLTADEIHAQLWAHNCIVVQSSSSHYHTPNKSWPVERMQHVVNQLNAAGYKIVQLGANNDVPLDDARHMQGSCSLRASGAILANAQLFIGLEGGLMHLARAVETPAVIVYTEYTRPEETGYPENINLRDPLAKSGCWRREPCANCVMSAQAITTAMVLDAAFQFLH